jgi:hypothetical protein
LSSTIELRKSSPLLRRRTVFGSRTLSHDDKGNYYELSHEPLWYIAPKTTTWRQGDKPFRPVDFGYVLHNARVAQGVITPAVFDLNGERPPTHKSGVAAEAENLLEDVRSKRHPHLPSRLSCFFLNLNRETAQRRANGILRGNNMITPCYVVANTGPIHFADMEVYERLCGSPENAALAEKYWAGDFVVDSPEAEDRLEILAKCILYFPEWETFPLLDTASVLRSSVRSMLNELLIPKK